MTPEFRINERTGGVCCQFTTDPCDKCKAHFRAAGLRVAASLSDYSPPDPWALPMRIAEVQETVARLAALAEEHKYFDTMPRPKPVLRLSAAELASYAPPDPYARKNR